MKNLFLNLTRQKIRKIQKVKKKMDKIKLLLIQNSFKVIKIKKHQIKKLFEK